MKKGVTIAILLVITIVFGGSLYYLYTKNKQSPVVFETDKSEVKTIVKKTVATGNIVPKEEVIVKPNISGIIQEIVVKAGDFVKIGDVIAKVRVVPSIDNLNSSKNQVESAKINLDNQKKVFERQKALYHKGVIATNEFDTADLAYTQTKLRSCNSELRDYKNWYNKRFRKCRKHDCEITC